MALSRARPALHRKSHSAGRQRVERVGVALFLRNPQKHAHHKLNLVFCRVSVSNHRFFYFPRRIFGHLRARLPRRKQRHSASLAQNKGGVDVLGVKRLFYGHARRRVFSHRRRETVEDAGQFVRHVELVAQVNHAAIHVAHAVAVGLYHAVSGVICSGVNTQNYHNSFAK